MNRPSHVELLAAACLAHPTASDLAVADWRADHTPGCHVVNTSTGAVLADAESREAVLLALRGLTPLVVEALTELKVRCDGDALTTAWRLATVWSRRWTWPDMYTEAAVRGLAVALASGDTALAARCARMIVDPAGAMDALAADLRVAS